MQSEARCGRFPAMKRVGTLDMLGTVFRAL
jgi:hypothetical protein